MDEIITIFVSRYNWWAYIVLLMIGLYAMIAKRNLVKKIIGLAIFQSAIILFFISIGAKMDATIPILKNGHGEPATHIVASDYINPLPHVLMLTAIVVSVATLSVALAFAIKVYAQFDTLEEDEILVNLNNSEDQRFHYTS